MASEHTRDGELSAGRRFAGTLGGLGLLALGSPGITGADGSLVLAVAGVALWGSVAARPGSRAWLVEWLAGAVAMALPVWWIAYVSPPALALYVAPGMGLYAVLQGVLARRLRARGLPLALAVAAGWICGETLRALVPPPLGLGWLRLGHHAHAHAWLAGGARVVGVQGIGFGLALVAGGLAELVGGRRRFAAAVIAAGLGVPALLGALVRPPEVEAGPRLLLVQMGVPQERKVARSARELLEAGMQATREGLAAAGEPPDLVCWGETMLPLTIAHPELRAAFEAGVRVEPWMRGRFDPEPATADLLAEIERRWVGEAILGLRPDGSHDPRGLLPEGTRFLAGAEEIAPAGGPGSGRVVQRIAAFLWEPDGTRGPSAGKQHLVPGAETMHGLERFAFVREACDAIVGYTPSFTPFEEAGRLALETRDGRRYELGITVCFDNAFVDPFVDAARAGADLHLVLSNEAWYRSSCELDQMIAFSKLAAIASGRSVVRTTNSGVTASIAPSGLERERLRVDGRDREVGGALALRPLVPTAAARAAGPTPFARTRPAWLALWVLGPLLALLRRPSARSEEDS